MARQDEASAGGGQQEHTCHHKGERVDSLALAAWHRHDAGRQAPSLLAWLAAPRRVGARRGTRRHARLGAVREEAGARASRCQLAPAAAARGLPLASPLHRTHARAARAGRARDASRSGTVGATRTRKQPMRRFSAAWLIRIVARAPAGAVTCLAPRGQPSKERRRDCCPRRPPPPPEASSPSGAAPAGCAGRLVQTLVVAGTERRRWSPL